MGYTLTDPQREVVDFVKKRQTAADKIHAPHRRQWEHFDRLYHSFRRDRDQLASSLPRDIYPAIRELSDKWGADFFVPYVFSTIETVLPRILSTRPKMLILPLEDEIEENVENMKALIDQQQAQMDIELKFQKVAKDGLIYGLGVGKSYWRKEMGKKTVIRPRTLPVPGMSKYVTQQKPYPMWDDAYFEWIDPFDFFWDPMATDVASCEFAIHRTWRSHDYVLDRIMEGDWTGVSPDDVDEQSGAQFYQEAHVERWRTAGLEQDAPRKDIHEVWEYHDHLQQRVITVLDRQVPVKDIPNPYTHGQLPFQIYRPTLVNGQLPGKGEADPIQDLQAEMNSMRRQIRDNATLAVQKWGFYSQGLFDEDDIQIGPGIFNAVPGNPSEAIYLPNVGDLPGAPIEEARQIAADINMTAGLSDVVRGTDVAPTATATSTQITVAQATERIKLKARLFEAELIKPASRQWLLMNQQMIVEDAQKAVRIPLPIEPGEMVPKYKHVKLGPMELQGDMFIEPEGGSTQPTDVPLEMQRGLQLWNALRDNPGVDQRMLIHELLKTHQVKMPEAWMSPMPAVPPEVLDMIVKVHPELKPLIDQAVHMSQQQGAEASQAPQQPQGQQEQVPAGVANG